MEAGLLICSRHRSHHVHLVPAYEHSAAITSVATVRFVA
jgi:hypothetical protein